MKHQESLLACGCCEGTDILTPLPTANRPGLDRLAYRVGTHATFLETMKARLSTLCLGDDKDCQADQGLRPLQQLTTRASSDPAIAFLDAWATVADVLTFYQERILNEGYLPTAAERRSILELARLVGYKLSPGVAASVYLAFELEEGYDIEIPAGTRAQSIPDGTRPDELPQSFETSELLPARAICNAIQPRQTRPQRITLDRANPDLESDARLIDSLYFQGTATNLDTNDPLLLVFGQDPGQQVLRRVQKVEVQQAEERTRVSLQAIPLEQIVADFITELQAALAHHIGTGPEGEVADDVKGKLKELQSTLAEDVAAAVALLHENLLAWREMLAQMPDTFTKLKPWLGDVVADLEQWEANLQPLLALAGMTAPAATATAATSPQQPIEGNGSSPYPPGSILPALAEYDWVDSLKQSPAVQPANGLALARNPAQTFNLKGDMAIQLLTTTDLALSQNFYQVVASAQLTPPSPVQVYALRTTASLFGHNAPKEIQFGTENGEDGGDGVDLQANPLTQEEWTTATDERGYRLFLDNAYNDILPEGYIAIQRLEDEETNFFRILTFPVNSIAIRSRNAYGLSGKTTVLDLPNGQTWWTPDSNSDENFVQFIRGTTVYAQSELLELAEAPISTLQQPVPVANSRLELDGLYDGLETGRWVIVSGERSDVANAAGVTADELVMIAGVEQSYDPTLPGDKPHTTLVLANEGLAYSYKRDTVTVYANVAKATHGETHQEVLGSGDGKRAFQQFDLKHSPLTYLPAPTPDGVASSLTVRVNDVRWHEAEALFPLDATSRNYITQTDNEQKTTVIFGDGQRGARLPTAVENVTATYRSGIGQPGNVAAKQITMLVTRPLGVKGVSNPLRASGGADPESRDQARRNVPLVTMALDRLVSLQDYEDFARTFAGIGKANATMLTDGQRQLVHLTIAGADDIPIDENSDLYRNLRLALQQNGDPFQPFQVQVRELAALVISANVRLHPDYQWESVAPQIRSAVLAAFSFQQRELGQDVLLSQVISVIQAVAGVTYVDVDILEGISETEVTDPALLAEKLAALTGQQPSVADTGQPKQRLPINLARVGDDGVIHPAQLAFLNPETPDTLILTEIS